MPKSLEIPDAAGAILLPDCTLFPQGALPLHIFEPRYREMLTEALEGDCLLCVGRLTDEESDDLSTCTARIGTIALIRASRELPDGRSHLVLHGVCRVSFLEWIGGRSYPYARIAPMITMPGPPTAHEEQLAHLRQAVEQVIEGFPEKVIAQIEQILHRTPTPAIMADAIAHQFVHDPDLRQELLEEPDVPKRVNLVVAHLESLRPGKN